MSDRVSLQSQPKSYVLLNGKQELIANAVSLVVPFRFKEQEYLGIDGIGDVKASSRRDSEAGE